MKIETIILDETKNTSLTCYIQQVEGEFGFKERPAVLILPGGGYSFCSDREADPIAFNFLNRGYHAFVLRYSLDKIWPNPLNDYEKAMEIIQSREDFHVAEHKIAVCGFSAGGHLAASAATMAQHRPNVAIIAYGSLTKDITDAMHVSNCPYPVDHVDNKTCPCFLFCSRDDTIVNPENTLKFSLALEEAKINYETRVYAYGGHGFGSGERYLCGDIIPAAEHRWMEDALAFCDYVLGSFSNKGFDEPKLKRCYVDDNEEYLSLNCSINHYLKNRDRFEKQVPEIYNALDALQTKLGNSLDGSILGNIQVSVVLQFIQMPKEAIDALAAKLATIRNN